MTRAHRSYQFSRYASVAFNESIGVRPFMGSVGDVYDHAMAHSLSASLKSELVA